MRIEIAQSIREILDERKTVTIQGLGSIKLVQKPAYFGDLRKTMFPPQVEMVFEERSSSNKLLIERLMLNEGLKKKDAEKALRKYSEAIVNALVNFGKVRLKGICRLDRLESGKIELQPNPAFIGAYYKDLPEVPVQIISPKASEKEKPTDIPPQAIEAIPPSVSLPTDEQKKGTPESSDKENISDAATSAVIGNLLAEMRAEPSENEPVEDNPDLEVQWDPNEDEGYGIVPWIIGSLLLLAIIVIAVMSLRSCQSSKDVPFSNEVETEHITDMIVDDSDPSSDSAESELTTIPEECIIITGSFASENNVRLMENRLTEAGHRVYKEVSGNYTRVGLKFECSGVDLPAYLQNIRATLAPKAWFLDPELYVEYE